MSREPGRHRIDVRVRTPGVQVSARRSYIVEPPPAATTETRAESPGASLLRTTLLGSAPQGQLRLAVHAVPRFAIGKAGALAISVLVADGGEAPVSPLDVVLVTFDDEGRPTQRHRVRVEPPAAGRPWQFSTELPLARGRHQLRVAAVTADGSKSGLVLTPVEIIEPGRDLRMGPPLLLEAAGGQVGPTASRRFDVGVPLGLQAEIAGRPVQENTVTVRVSVAVPSGSSLRTADGEIDAGRTPDRRRATGVPQTGGLAPGQYLLVAEAVSTKSGALVRHAVPIDLVAPTTPDADVSPLRHSVVARGPVSRHPAPATLVIRTDEKWERFWSRLPTRQAAPPIDFSRATLFAIVAPTGAGHGAPEVTMITDAGTHTIVRWRTAARSSGADMEGANPFVVALPRVVGPVRFEPVP